MVTPGETVRHDVFLSYQSADRERVDAVRRSLVQRRVRAFLDRQDLVAGLPWPQALEQALQSVRAVLVFVGGRDGEGDSLGLWQRHEVWFALDRQAQEEGQGRSFPVIPVLLPGARPGAGFLFLNTWIDLRDAAVEPAAVDAITSAVLGAARAPVGTASLGFAPYRALEPFREEHAAIFFGREAFSSALLDRVRERSLVALVGPSGSGKSSVVQAGLVPLLRRQRPPHRAWDIAMFRPGDEPFHRLAASLVPLLEPDTGEVDRLASGRKLGDCLADGSVRLADVVDRLMAKSHGTDRLLIVADQFEELFTLAPASHRQPFVRALLGALDRAPLALLLALRADFYAQAIELDRGLSDGIQSGLVNLGPMTRDELRRAVEQPAARAEVSFETGLVDRILGHVETQPGSLPLLEFALAELWERRDSGRITHAAYDVIGQVAGAISQRAEAVFGGLEATRKRAALSLFTRLVRAAAPGDPEPDTRRRVPLDALTEPERGVIGPFVEARLLVLGRGEAAATPTVEVAHEALIRSWRRLGEWVDQQREFLLWRQRLGQALAEWERTARDREALLRGPALKEAVAWTRERTADLSGLEREFIRLSRRTRQRRRRWLGAAVAVAALIAAAIPALYLASRTNFVQVWAGIRVAPVLFQGAPPSLISAWAHAADIGGHLEAIGSALFGFPPPLPRLWALQHAAVMMADLGRTADANRLADRAIALAQKSPDFEASLPGQMAMALTLSDIGRPESAHPFAHRALTLAREIRDPGPRAFALAHAARALARAGLEREARESIDEARAAVPAAVTPANRAEVESILAESLARIGEVDEALMLVARHPDWPLPLSVVQVLIDGGHLEQARTLVGASDNSLAVAMVASALASRGRSADGRVLAATALALVEKGVFGSAVRDSERGLLHSRLLLRIMKPSDAATLIRDRANPDEMAGLAVALAQSGLRDLAREMAGDAARRADAVARGHDRWRALAKIVQALARSGDAEAALSLARKIEEREQQAAALAHAAYGFASTAQPDRARTLAGEVDTMLPSISDPQQRSSVRTVLALTNIRLGRYAAALDDEQGWLTNADRLAIHTAVIRDDALRRDGRLREAFEQGPGRGLGRVGLYVP